MRARGNDLGRLSPYTGSGQAGSTLHCTSELLCAACSGAQDPHWVPQLSALPCSAACTSHRQPSCWQQGACGRLARPRLKFTPPWLHIAHPGRVVLTECRGRGLFHSPGRAAA